MKHARPAEHKTFKKLKCIAITFLATAVCRPYIFAWALQSDQIIVVIKSTRPTILIIIVR